MIQFPTSPYYEYMDEDYPKEGTPFDMAGGERFLRRFLVRVRIPQMAPMIVSLCPGIPLGGSPYIAPGNSEWDTRALCVRKTARPKADDDWQNWIVDCEYSRNIPTGTGRSAQREGSRDKPEQESPDVSWDFETMQIAPLVDWTGKPFMNSAKQYYTPAVTLPVYYPVLNISRNELAWNVERSRQYSGALNSDTFLGYPAQTVQCHPPKANAKYRGSFSYWRTTYKLAFAPIIPDPDATPSPDYSTEIGQIYRPWQPWFLDAGMNERRTDLFVGPPGPGGLPSVLVPIYTAAHVRVTHPEPLDGHGRHLLPDPATGQIRPVYNKYDWFPRFSFKDLLVKGLGGPPPIP